MPLKDRSSFFNLSWYNDVFIIFITKKSLGSFPCKIECVKLSGPPPVYGSLLKQPKQTRQYVKSEIIRNSKKIFEALDIWLCNSLMWVWCCGWKPPHQTETSWLDKTTIEGDGSVVTTRKAWGLRTPEKSTKFYHWVSSMAPEVILRAEGDWPPILRRPTEYIWQVKLSHYTGVSFQRVLTHKLKFSSKITDSWLCASIPGERLQQFGNEN